MKLRLRLVKQTKVISLDDSNSTLGALKEAVKNEFDLSNFRLSLNKETFLEGDSTQLSGEGIVSGDLIFIITVEEGAISTSSHSASNPQPTSSKEGGSSRTSNQPITEMSSHATADSGTRKEEESEPIQDEAANRLLKEPLLINESTEREGLPQCVVKAYETADVKNDKEAMCVICHILMTEVGFFANKDIAGAESSELIDKFAFPSGWKIPGSYRFSYYYPQMEGVNFTLVLVPLGNQIMVHGSAEQGEETHLSQMQIKPSDYTIAENLVLGPGAVYKIPLLNKFSRQFKDTVAYPLLYKSQSENAPIVPRLDCLVLELKLQILKHLDLKSLLTASEVCKSIAAASKEPVLWRRMFLRDFGRRVDNDLSLDWKALYKGSYMSRQHVRRMMNVDPIPTPRPEFYTPPVPDFPIAPTHPGFIIGGDYDRDPNFSGLIDPVGGGRLPGMGPRGPNPLMPRPRFDPYGPLPDQQFRPGRGGGIWDEMRPPGSGRRRDPFGGSGGFGGGGII